MFLISRLVLLIAFLLIGCSSGDRVQKLSDQDDVLNTINTLFIETDNRN
jgi:uncharacterized protein YcfL